MPIPRHVTRRQFLASAAALSLAPQLEQFVRRAPPQHVLVVGGGLAGLCTAYELQRLGHTVTVVEATSRPGGRVRTIRDRLAPGLRVEAGAEQIPAAHTITQHYARELGLTLLPSATDGQSLYFVRGQRVLETAGATWPYTFNEDERNLGLGGLWRKYIAPDIERAAVSGFPDHTPQALAPYDAHTLGSWLRERGASADAAALLAVGFGTDFSSAAAFLLHVLNSRGAGTAYSVDGGNDRLPAAFAQRVDIRYDHPVVAIRQDDRGVDVTVDRPGARQVLHADRVVCCLPCPVIGRILDDARVSDQKRQAIREQNYSHTVKVFLQTRTRFWRRAGLNGFVESDLPIERLTPDPGTDVDARGALAAYPIGPFASVLERADERERVAMALEQAAQMLPDIRGEFEGGFAHCWGLEPWQGGAFALHTPGQIRFLDVLAAAEGRIHFAGEHTSPWTGWMQGALESARRVVREING